MESKKIIPINIWDDFYDDGFVPKGEKLETCIYVEDDDIPLDKKKIYLEILLKYIKQNLNTNNIKLWLSLIERKSFEGKSFDSWQIKIEGLTHKRLHEWMVDLKNVDLKCDNIPFLIYSES